MLVVLEIVAFAACNRTRTEPAPGKPATAAPAAAPAAPAPAAPVLRSGERRLTVSDGAELYLKIAGQGPVCLFVHGGPGQGSRSFEQMGGNALEQFLTVIYLDQRGSGLSKDAASYHLERVTQDFEEVRQALGVDKLCVIAHSFGGILAVDYARRYPARVSKLVLANATLQFLGPEQRRMQIDFVNRALGRKVVDVPADADAPTLAAAHAKAREELARSGQGYRLLGENVETVRTQARVDSYERSRGFGSAVIAGREALPEYFADHAPVSAEIALPVLVIASAGDHAVGPDEHRRFRFPDQRIVTLNTGHMSYFEDTAGFADAIRRFVVGAAP